MARYKLGRLPRGHDPRIPHMSALLAGQVLPPPPDAVDYTHNMPANLGMMLNGPDANNPPLAPDGLGDCTCAAVYHALQVWSFNASGGTAMQTQPDRDVEQLYIHACGYKPSVAGEGPGGHEQKVLTYILKNGAPFGASGTPTHKISAFVEVDPRNQDDVKRTICDCGVAYIGFNVPQFLMPADGPTPAVWDVQAADTTIIGGHAVVLAGYDAAGARVVSWGQYYTMTWAFFAQYVDETYAIADSTWIEGGGNTPGGLSLAQLEAQMQAIKEGGAALG